MDYQNFVHDGAGYGLAQWTFWSRKTNLHEFVKHAGKSISGLETQLDFLIKELSENYKSVFLSLKSASSVAVASNCVLLQYERPANMGTSVQSQRASYGATYYQRFVKKSGGIKMSNSSLVNCTVKSPNHSGARTHSIDTITPHCVVGQLSASEIGGCFTSSSRQASCNYGIGKDGSVVLCVDECNRSWCSSSNSNDQRAVTIECASDKTAPYAMNDKVYAKLIDLCMDICKRNGKSKLLWLGDKTKTLNYQPKSDEMVITVHRWFANKSCPGNWLYARLGDLAEKVTAQLGGADEVIPSGMQAREFQNLTEAQVVAKVGALFTADQRKSGILASVSMAQFILESGYGKNELAQGANNCFGMKKSLSGNTWGGSAWDGVSIYTKKTQEQKADGSYVTITADFRRYSCVEDSIADHSAYLLEAKNGSKLRYEGLKGCTDYKKAVQIIKNGGYATSLTYVEKLCGIIERWNLTKWDVKNSGASDTMVKYYRVRKSWENASSQKGAFTVLANAERCAAANEGYKVFDWDGNQVYPEPVSSSSYPDCPFSVQVKVSDLKYMASPSTTSTARGVTGIGTFTIVEVKDGWGRLKSGAGWIYLENPEYCTIGKGASSAPAYREYTVKHGDCLWAIAASQLGDGKRWTEIKSLNGLSSNVLYSGQVLKLPN